MSIAKTLLIGLLNLKTYIWIDTLLINETKKAILIEFDGKKIWLPKAWIAKINRKCHCEEQNDEAISIKISEYYGTLKSQ